MEETSLGDFVEEADSGAEPGGDADGDPASGRSTAVEPARPTSVWTPEAADCERCGGTVRRRYRDGGSLVCAGCVDW